MSRIFPRCSCLYSIYLIVFHKDWNYSKVNIDFGAGDIDEVPAYFGLKPSTILIQYLCLTYFHFVGNSIYSCMIIISIQLNNIWEKYFNQLLALSLLPYKLCSQGFMIHWYPIIWKRMLFTILKCKWVCHTRDLQIRTITKHSDVPGIKVHLPYKGVVGKATVQLPFMTSHR